MSRHEPPTFTTKARRQQKISLCRCLTITCFIFTTAIVLWLISLPVFVLKKQFNDASNPHEGYMLDETLLNGSSPNQSVRSLIDQRTRFDVAFSVWARVANADSSHPERWDELNMVLEDQTNATQLAMRIATGLPQTELDNDPAEELVLFSDIVLRNISLADQKLHASINFSLPLKRLSVPVLNLFQTANQLDSLCSNDLLLYDKDVRATVSLLPISSSPLDRISSISDWRPAGAEPLPRLSTQ